MNISIRNLPSNLLLLHKTLEEIIKDFRKIEDEDSSNLDYVTVSQFANHYHDLVSPCSLRRRLRNYKEDFKNYMDTDEKGRMIFCPIRMLEHLERYTPRWVIKNRCQKYLNELEECD